MKRIIGAVLSALSGAGVAYGIMTTISEASAERCFSGACEPPMVAIAAIGVGTIAFVASAFLWHGTWLVGPPVGLVTALALAVRDGVEFTADTIGFSAFIALCVLAGPIILAGLLVRGRAKARQAQRLVATGQRAVAHVQGARQTGVYINNQPQVAVDYVIRPLDGTAPFPHQKTQTIGYAAIPPRPGLTWPAWYDPGDRSKVAIGAPSGAAIDAHTQATLQEFGISLTQAFGYDPHGGQPAGWGPRRCPRPDVTALRDVPQSSGRELAAVGWPRHEGGRQAGELPGTPPPRRSCPAGPSCSSSPATAATAASPNATPRRSDGRIVRETAWRRHRRHARDLRARPSASSSDVLAEARDLRVSHLLATTVGGRVTMCRPLGGAWPLTPGFHPERHRPTGAWRTLGTAVG